MAKFWCGIAVFSRYHVRYCGIRTPLTPPSRRESYSCSILNLVYFDSLSWQSFVKTCDVFNCLFPLDVQNEIQLLSGVFCYSWLVCLLSFWLRNTLLVKVGNPISDGIILVFHLAWCIKTVEKSEAILALLDTFQELHLKW